MADSNSDSSDTSNTSYYYENGTQVKKDSPVKSKTSVLSRKRPQVEIQNISEPVESMEELPPQEVILLVSSSSSLGSLDGPKGVYFDSDESIIDSDYHEALMKATSKVDSFIAPVNDGEMNQSQAGPSTSKRNASSPIFNELDSKELFDSKRKRFTSSSYLTVENMEIEDDLVVDNVFFTTFLGLYSKILGCKTDETLNEKLLKTLNNPVERAQYIRKSIVKACVEVFHDKDLKLTIYPQSRLLAEHIMYVVVNYPHVFCKERPRKKKMKKGRKPNKFIIDNCPPQEIEELLEIVFTVLPALLFLTDMSADDTISRFKRLLDKLLNLLYKNSQSSFHWALENIQGLVIGIMNCKQIQFTTELKYTSGDISFRITIPTTGIKADNVIKIIEVLRKYWYYYINRCVQMAEGFLKIMCWAWEILELPEKFEIIQHFPVPLSETSMQVDVHASYLFELIVRDSLELIESPEFITFCRLLDKFQFVHDSFASVLFNLQVHRILSKIINSKHFRMSRLELTKTNLVRLLCRVDAHFLVLPSASAHNFSADFVRTLPKQLPLALPEFGDIIFKETVLSLGELSVPQPDLTRPSAEDGHTVCKLSPSFGTHVKKPEAKLVDVSLIWRILIEEWHMCLLNYQREEHVLHEKLMVLSCEIIKLGGLVYKKFMMPRDRLKLSPVAEKFIRQVQKEEVNLIIFPFRELKSWTIIAGQIMQTAERERNGMEIYLALVSVSLISMPPLFYNEHKLGLQEVQKAWIYFVSSLWWPAIPLIKYPVWTCGSYFDWKNESLTNCDILLESCVKVLANDAVSPVVKYTLSILDEVISKRKYKGSVMGLLNIIGDFHKIIRKFDWQVIYSFIQNVIEEQPWLEDDLLATCIARAIARLPCIVSSKQEEIESVGIVLSDENGCRICSTNGRNDFLGNVVDPLFECEFDTTVYKLLQPIILYCKHVQVKSEAIEILHRLKCHGREPTKHISAIFIYHIAEPSTGFMIALLKSLKEYLEYNKLYEEYSAEHVHAFEVVFMKLTIHIRSFQPGEKLKEILRLGLGLIEVARTKDIRLRTELVKLVMNIILMCKSNVIDVLCKRLFILLAEENKSTPWEILSSVRYYISKDLTSHCLSAFFGPKSKIFDIPVEPPPKGRRRKSTVTPNSKLDVNIQYITDGEKILQNNCKIFLEQFAYIAETKESFAHFYSPVLLAELIPLMRKDRRHLLMIHSLATFSDVSVRGLLLDFFPVYFPMLVANSDIEVINDVMTILYSQGVETEFTRKCAFQPLTVEMVMRLSVNKKAILRHFAAVPQWAEGKLYKTPPPTSVQTAAILDFIGDRLMGLYAYVDQRLHSREESWETKIRILSSFAELMSMIGQKRIGPSTMKVFSTLKAFATLGDEILDILCKVWAAFAKALPESNFSAMIRQILGEIISLARTHTAQETLDELVVHLIQRRRNVFRSLRNELYFLVDNVKEPRTLKMIQQDNPKGSVLFRVLVQEIYHYNNQVQYLAMKQILKFLADYITNKRLLELDDTQSQFRKLVVGLMQNTRSTDFKTRLLAGKCIGYLGSMDNFSSIFKNLNLSNAYSVVGKDFSVSLPRFGAPYLEELSSQLQVTLQVDEFDHCAFCTQEILKLYKVEENDNNPVWKLISPQARVLLKPLLQTKYMLIYEDLSKEYPSPIYGSEYGKDFHLWVSNWLLQMISYLKEASFRASLFNLSKSMIVRSVKLASFVLPNVAVYAVMDCSEESFELLRDEMHNVLLEGAQECTIEQYEENSELIDLESKLPFPELCHRKTNTNVEVMDRVLCTTAILSIMDTLSMCVRMSTYYTTNIISKNTWSLSPCALFGLSKIDINRMISLLLDYKTLSQAAFRIESYQRSLFYIEEYLTLNPEKLQKTLPYLQKIYVALKDLDGISGLVELRKNEPSTAELVLDNLAGMKSVEASYVLQRMVKEDPESLIIRQAYIQSYLTLDQPEMAYNLIDALEKQKPQSRDFLQFCRAEACWNLEKWDELEQLVEVAKHNKIKKWTFSVADIFVSIKKNELTNALTSIGNARKRILKPLALILNVEDYHKRSKEVTKLQALAEVEQVVELLQAYSSNTGEEGLRTSTPQNFRADTLVLLKNWNSRTVDCHTLDILDPILHIRKTLLKLMRKHLQSESWAGPLLDNSIRDNWLHLAKAHRKTKNFIQVRNCLEETRAYSCAAVIYQEAKYLSSSGEPDRAISLLKKAISLRSDDEGNWRRKVEEGQLICDDQKLHSKLCLLFAITNDNQSNLSGDENTWSYNKVIELNHESERNHFHAAYCFSRILEGMESKRESPVIEMLTSGVVSLVSHYCQSLRYGCKYIYHSLPSLLSVWLDGRWAKLLKPTFDGCKWDTDHLIPDTLKELTRLVETYPTIPEKLKDHVPAYFFLTAFSQLISRLCHSDMSVWLALKGIIAHTICEYPHQGFWMTMAVSKSTLLNRKDRCNEIFQCVIQKKEALRNVFRDYKALTKELIEFATKVDQNIAPFTMSQIQPNVRKLITSSDFSDVLVPFQAFLSCCLPRKIGNFDHRTIDPFPHREVYIEGVEESVQVMKSLQKPKKITFRGSDGKLYGVLVKANDDLRKDSKVVEMNNILNWYMGRDFEARQRQLHIRTYAVIPLDAKFGLIEWVPNLRGFRHCVAELISRKGNDCKFLQNAQNVCKDFFPVEKKMEVLVECLRRYKPVMAEWFLLNFADARVWYLSRENFTRTAAVMSMFGYLLGLGDRHGDNVSIDTTTGEIVHVDFNCLFNKSDTFRWPDKVPFRLTHNMTNAMGILGYEGTFRRSCEVTLRVIRSNDSIFNSVLREFIFDPLLEWTVKRSNLAAVVRTEEMTNEKALEILRLFKLKSKGRLRNNKKDKVELALSVEGQVSHLIKEATDPNNLCLMFPGWTPWL